jgi:catechol 2,3-dioxygenase-like lactoylglutathione lyase family enzyme
MKIGFVRVFVTDFKKSLGFYTNKLGLELDYSDESGWAQFKSGEDVSLAIESCAADRVEQGSRLVGRFVGVTLMVDSISETYEELSSKGVEFTGKPEKQPWGGTLVNLKDPDGNVLTLMESAD